MKTSVWIALLALLFVTAANASEKVVPDERIPGTMHVGHTPPVVVQAFIFIAIIEVDLITLSAMIGPIWALSRGMAKE